MITWYPQNSPQPKRKISEEFTLKNATPFGGFNLLADFMDSLGFSKTVARHLELAKAHWADYPLASIIEIMVQGYACGLQRPYHFQAIENDPVITHKHGYDRLPDHTTFNKDLKRFDSHDDVRQLLRIHRDLIQDYLGGTRSLVIDFDSTVETVYGNQQNSAVGYNPQKPGRPSYHPLLAYEANTGLVLNATLRPGNAVSATDAVPFIQETLAMYPATKRLVRLDKGFDSNEIMETLEDENCGYVIKLRFRSTLAAAVLQIPKKKWKPIGTGEEETEITYFRYQAGSWSRPRRVVVVRKKTDPGAQRSFWDEWRYRYSVYVTNLPWPAADIYQFYHHRGGAENLVKESKYGFGIDCIPTGDFYPNWADLLLKLMAYNVFVLFQKALLPKAKGRLTATTLRRLFITLPAQLVCRAGRWILKLPETFKYQQIWRQARATFSTA